MGTAIVLAQRGRLYGRTFTDPIHAFLDIEIYQRFVKKPPPNDAMLHYAGACAKAVKEYSPLMRDEGEGLAEGSALRLEGVVLLTLHEELNKQGVLPAVEYWTAFAAGPPDSRDGHSYVGQNRDWLPSRRSGRVRVDGLAGA